MRFALGKSIGRTTKPQHLAGYRQSADQLLAGSHCLLAIHSQE